MPKPLPRRRVASPDYPTGPMGMSSRRVADRWLQHVRGNPEAIADWIKRLRADYAAEKAGQTKYGAQWLAQVADQGRILQELYVEATGAPLSKEA